MKNAIWFLGLYLWLGFAEPAGTQLVGDEAAIRAARARSNRAIAEHDSQAVASHWSDDFHIITSRSTQISGRESNRENMARHFEDFPDVVYVREPTEVKLFVPWGMAFERGSWQGSWSEGSGRVAIGGEYAAKWRKIEDRWFIESEVYSPTFCSGTDYCTAAP